MLEQLNVWKNKLLDLGKRNRMLNFSPAQTTTLKIVSPSVDDLFTNLLGASVYEAATTEPEENGAKKNGKAKKILIAEGTDADCRRTLYRLRSKAKEAVEEQGINLLYMAFGFVHWREEGKEGSVFRAPLLLVPVKLTVNSFRSPYNVSLYEEEAITNPTLKYKLKESYNIELPDMENDGEMKFTDFVKNVRKLLTSLNWTVTTEVYLGFFSFAKLNMYMDIDSNAEQISNNPLIKAFCGQRVDELSFDADKWVDLDGAFSAENTYCVVDADSSQLEAIHYAREGKSFVLQGPPGTGKSQTITNIISTLIADGKKVLFVAEKLAALEVVYSNLKKVGLGDFCLQLHSHKANKMDITQELCNTLNQPKTAAQKSIIEDLSELEKTKAQLNAYSSMLAREIDELSCSTYELFGLAAKFAKFPEVSFDLDRQNLPDKVTLRENVALINQYIDYVPTVGYDYRESPHFGYAGTDNSFEKIAEVTKLLEETLNAMQTLSISGKEVEKEFNLFVPTTIEAHDRLKNLIFVIGNLDDPQESWFNTQLNAQLVGSVRRLNEHIINVRSVADNIEGVGLPLLECDIDTMVLDFVHTYKGPLRGLKRGYKKAMRLINDNVKTKLNYSGAAKLLIEIKKHKDAEKFLFQHNSYFQQHLAGNYQGFETDCEKILPQLEALSECLMAIKEFGKTACGKAICSHRKGHRKMICRSYVSNLSNLKGELDKLGELFDEKVINFKKTPLPAVTEKLEDVMNNIGRLTDWISFRKLQTKLARAKVLAAVEKFTAEGLPVEEFAGTYLRRCYYMWLDDVCNLDGLVQAFTREKQDNLIKTFCEKDKLQLRIAQARIREKLSAARPNVNSVAQNSEVAILTREGDKKRKHMPIRKLLSSIPNLLPRLKPCLLMSPMSVSQFLSPVAEQFDTVIFDEASQIFPEDAIVAIYRGRQIIIVGDSLQLPPTNFFNLSQEDNFDTGYDENAADTEFESVLDVGNVFLNKVKLKWHYRSKYEELIAFSNSKIYRNELVTFPPPQKKNADKGVEFVYVSNGVYERSTTRSNKTEAVKVVELIVEHFKKHPKRSLGVVAFSQAQAEAIESEINLLRRTTNEFETFFDENKPEPFFVKNIESVQGDERDTIFFSIGYGKDANGKMYNNFGPLSRDGGERRLNVAITRAKYNIKLVGSIMPGDIADAKAKQGAKLLKAYIQYAINGSLPSPQKTFDENGNLQTALEEDVAEVLVKAGYKLEKQVGSSAYKINLAVLHPTDEKTYVLGIECDGQSYYASRTARDRDRLRREVLNGLSWQLYRIWSTDWIRRRETEIRKLLDAVKSAIKNMDTAAEEEAAVQPMKVKKEKKIIEKIVAEPKKSEVQFKKYTPVDYSKLKVVTAEARIRAIIAAEGPIHEELLLKRACWIFGREKVTSYVRVQFDAYWIKAAKTGYYKQGDFYFDNSGKPVVFRVPAQGDEPRKAELIHIDELVDGIVNVVRSSVGISREGIISEILRLLSVRRSDSQFTVVSKAIDEAVSLQKIVKKNNLYVFAENS